VSRWVPSGAGAQREGQAVPVVPEGEGGRQVEHEAPHRDDDLRAELEHLLAQGPDLGPGPAGVGGFEPQLL
jgi:hypothetical protein